MRYIDLLKEHIGKKGALSAGGGVVTLTVKDGDDEDAKWILTEVWEDCVTLRCDKEDEESVNYFPLVGFSLALPENGGGKDEKKGRKRVGFI